MAVDIPGLQRLPSAGQRNQPVERATVEQVPPGVARHQSADRAFA